MTRVKAGGQILGGTPIDQQREIGRFSVEIDGVVTANANGFSMNGAVTGELDRQYYMPGGIYLVG